MPTANRAEEQTSRAHDARSTEGPVGRVRLFRRRNQRVPRPAGDAINSARTRSRRARGECDAVLPRDEPPRSRGRRAPTPAELSNIIGLEGYATKVHPPTQPCATTTRPTSRDPLLVAELGQEKWDRFQTLSGIQFYFDTDFQVLFGHVYYAGLRLGALVDQARPACGPRSGRSAEDGYVSIMSVDIGDWRHPVAGDREVGVRVRRGTNSRRGLAASHVGVPRRASVNTSRSRNSPHRASIRFDHFIELRRCHRAPRAQRRAVPHPDRRRLEEPSRRHTLEPEPRRHQRGSPHTQIAASRRHCGVWQAGHGGYLVHFDKLVFAGTWCKTFTRMTSMEAACESARHAVNAILDHYLYAASGQTDHTVRGRRCGGTCPTGSSTRTCPSPIRFPTPAGDYCFITDCENREPGDTRPTRDSSTACACKTGVRAPVDAVGHRPGGGRGLGGTARTAAPRTLEPTRDHRAAQGVGAASSRSRSPDLTGPLVRRRPKRGRRNPFAPWWENVPNVPSAAASSVEPGRYQGRRGRRVVDGRADAGHRNEVRDRRSTSGDPRATRPGATGSPRSLVGEGDDPIPAVGDAVSRARAAPRGRSGDAVVRYGARDFLEAGARIVEVPASNAASAASWTASVARFAERVSGSSSSNASHTVTGAAADHPEPPDAAEVVRRGVGQRRVRGFADQ